MAQTGEISGIGWTGGLKWLAFAVLTPIVVLVTPVLAVLGGFAAYHAWVPAYAATYTIAAIPAELRLRFHMVWDETTDSGRYLTIATPRLTRTLKLCGFDWIHFSRTSVYLTETRDIAVLGPQGCDYLFDSATLERKSPFGIASDAWSYLGAFILVKDGAGRKGLRFIDAARLPECIQTTDAGYPYARKAARRQICPPPTG